MYIYVKYIDNQEFFYKLQLYFQEKILVFDYLSFLIYIEYIIIIILSL